MKTVLIADDNPASRELLREALESPSLRFIEASDGQEALRKIQSDAPDLVLLDIQMPSLDGFAVLRAVRELDPPSGVRVIALTAFAMESDRQRVLEAGFDGYVSKPISIAGVRAQVERLLSAKE
jgi:CheY-like chemotaxis protein